MFSYKNTAFHFTCLMDWSGVDYLWIIVMFFIYFTHSDGTHSLQRIHWWATDVMLNISKSVLMKKQTHLHCGFISLIFQWANDGQCLCMKVPAMKTIFRLAFKHTITSNLHLQQILWNLDISKLIFSKLNTCFLVQIKSYVDYIFQFEIILNFLKYFNLN